MQHLSKIILKAQNVVWLSGKQKYDSVPGSLTKQCSLTAHYPNHPKLSKVNTKLCQVPRVMTRTDKDSEFNQTQPYGSWHWNKPEHFQAITLPKQRSDRSFYAMAERDEFLIRVDAELAHIVNSHHCKTWETVSNPSAENIEYISLTAMSGPNKRATSSLTPSVFDQVLLSLEGRVCRDTERKLASKGLQECRECPEPGTEFSQYHLLPFLAQGLTESWTQWRSELWPCQKSRTTATKPGVAGAGGIMNS